MWVQLRHMKCQAHQSSRLEYAKMTTQVRERREENMSPKAGRGKTAIQTEGQSQRFKGSTDDAKSTSKARPAPDAIGRPISRISRRRLLECEPDIRGFTSRMWKRSSRIRVIRSVAAGSLVTVIDERGATLGTAMYSDASLITLRMVTQELVGRTR